MERDFYRDEFEQLLKDSTDDFKMYPSRKVWHSIYNDLHPDRKWPSLAVCLLLLTAILYVGVSNNNSINSATRRNSNNFASQSNTAENSNVSTAKAPGSHSARSIVFAGDIPATNLPVTATNLQLPSSLFLGDDPQTGSELDNHEPEAGNEQLSSASSALTSLQDGRIAISVAPSQPELVNTASGNSANASADITKLDNEKTNTSLITDESTDPEIAGSGKVKPAGMTEVKEAKFLNTKDTREKEWIEHYAFYNQPAKRKKMLAGLDGEFYLTPGVGYRVMFLNSDYKKINNALVAANSAARYDEPSPLQLNQQIGLTMEMGGNISKKISNKLRVKAGLQLNISDYITYAKKLDHPGQTTLALTSVSNSMISFENRSTNFANVPGENTSQLHNKTVQVSVPLGADYKLLSTGKLSWHVGGSIQPTYITGGYAYLVSADNNYFVEDQSMLRKWNLNGAVESFVSIRTKQGSRINLGPQFRYSLFSAYKNSYSYTEKPYSIGFKIGLSKSF